MGNFIVRVIFYGNEERSLYSKLLKAMDAAGFKTTVVGARPGEITKSYELPTAEFLKTASVSKETIIEDAMRIAKVFWNTPGVVVAEYSGIIWTGLPTIGNT